MMKHSDLRTQSAWLASAALLAGGISAWSGLEQLGHAQGKDQDSNGVVLKTPAGGFEASGKVKASEIGLPVYPGAKSVADRDQDNGNLTLSLSRQGKPDVHFLVAKFETRDSVDQVRDYYQKKLGKDVTKFTSKAEDGSMSFEMKKANDRAKFVQIKTAGGMTEIDLVRVEGINVSDGTDVK
ncbi:MAG TPA: hypothetical protein VI455_12720 [Terriglobia bacterium]